MDNLVPKTPLAKTPLITFHIVKPAETGRWVVLDAFVASDGDSVPPSYPDKYTSALDWFRDYVSRAPMGASDFALDCDFGADVRLVVMTGWMKAVESGDYFSVLDYRSVKLPALEASP